MPRPTHCNDCDMPLRCTPDREHFDPEWDIWIGAVHCGGCGAGYLYTDRRRTPRTTAVAVVVAPFHSPRNVHVHEFDEPIGGVEVCLTCGYQRAAAVDDGA